MTKLTQTKEDAAREEVRGILRTLPTDNDRDERGLEWLKTWSSNNQHNINDLELEKIWQEERRNAEQGGIVDNILGNEKLTIAQKLLELAESAQYFVGESDTAFARFKVEDHYEVWPVESRRFKDWLRRRYKQAEKKPPRSNDLNDVITMLRAEATEQRQTFIRVGKYQNKVYLDLSDKDWRVVEIDREGWRVLDESPIMFRRSKLMVDLPVPDVNGNFDDLRQFLNLEGESGDDNWLLIKAFLAATMNADKEMSQPILGICGEAGSAKTTASRIIKQIIDPTPPREETQSLPRKEEDLVLAAREPWLCVFDNVSWLPPWVSDSLCRLSTGSRLSRRTKYEDSEVSNFSAIRPLILNSIEETITRGDLLSRSIVIKLEPISKRLPEVEFWQTFHERHASVLGGLCNAVSRALRVEVKIDKLPRMAEFAKWAAQAADDPDAFLTAYERNIGTANETALESSLIAEPIKELVKDCKWEGSATQLRTALGNIINDEKITKSKSWPSSAKAMSDHLRRIAPNLRREGICVESGRNAAGRFLKIDKSPSSSQKSPEQATETAQTPLSDEIKAQLAQVDYGAIFE